MFLKARDWLGTFYKYKYSYGRVSFSDIGESFEIFLRFTIERAPRVERNEMLLEDKRVKERQKKGQKWFLKRKYEEKKNTESTENNSILIQLSDFLWVFIFQE